jgi:mannan endo-1,4-beta-mannosidase
MYPQRHLFHRQAHVGKFDGRIALLLALFTFLLVSPGVFAVQLKITPPTLTVPAGGTATATLTISGATAPVNLAASGVPAGVSISFDPNPILTGNSTMILSAAITAQPGTFAMTITATSGTQTASITVEVTVTNAGVCHIGYSVINQWSTGFEAALSINNTGATAVNGWTLTWSFADGQTITQLWNGQETQTVAKVTVTSLSYNASIPAGGSYSAAGFTANWNGSTNSIPTAFWLNGIACD